MVKLQQYPVCSHNILDYKKSPRIDFLISGRLGPIPGRLATLPLTRCIHNIAKKMAHCFIVC